MRIILTNDVARLGAEGDVVEVAGGYARNYLFPRQLAVVATRGALRDIETRRRSLEGKRAHAREGAEAIVERIHAHPITIRRKAADDGRLHGSVTSMQLVELMRNEIGVELDRKQLELHEPIRHLGSFLVTVRPHPDAHGELSITVISDTAPVEKSKTSEEETQEGTAGPEAEAEEAAGAEA